MQSSHTDDEDDETHHPARPLFRGRGSLIVLFTLLLVFLLIAFIPPEVNVSRFQKRIASNISAALGRPVHFDSVSLTLLPLPGFTLKTFVIDEDPAFGFEPVLRADQVEVTLRISSLWHPRVEFSKIAFTEPSVNLVHAANGKWNIESLLLQASHIQAAPTGQRFAGPARRFPYIEATGARLNLKLDQEKTPVSLTDADFALWLPEPHQWHVRLEAHPMRTDTSPGDTGTIRAEGTLGGSDLDAASLAQIPIDLHGDWRDAQLGGIGRLLLGRDPGLRGDFSMAFSMNGTVGHNAIATRIKIAKARRADFVPDHMLALEASCNAVAGDTYHSFTSIECHWPPADSSDPNILLLTASLPDIRYPQSASASVTLPALPADTLTDWLSIATPHPPSVLAGAGNLAGTLNWGAPSASTPTVPSESTAGSPENSPASGKLALTGELELAGSSLDIDSANHRSIPLRDVVLRSTPLPSPPPARSHKSRAALAALQTAPSPDSFDLLPISLALGGKQPAILDGHLDASGYTLHLTGTVLCARLIEFGNAVPQMGDGLEPLLDQIADATPAPESAPGATPTPEGRGALKLPTPAGKSGALASNSSAEASTATASPVLPTVPIHVDLTATRAWGGPQIWRQTAPPVPVHRKRR
jgi:AsmA family